MEDKNMMNGSKWVTPWPEHNFTWNEEKLTTRGFVAADRKAQAGINGYNLYRNDSSSTFFTAEKLKMIGYISMVGVPSGGAPARAATPTPTPTPTPPPAKPTTPFCEPWPEHDIEWDIDLIKSKGYTGSRQELHLGIKGYLFFQGSESRFLSVDTLCMLKLAKRGAKKADEIKPEGDGAGAVTPDSNVGELAPEGTNKPYRTER